MTIQRQHSALEGPNKAKNTENESTRRILQMNSKPSTNQQINAGANSTAQSKGISENFFAEKFAGKDVVILQEQGRAKDTSAAGQGDAANDSLSTGMLAGGSSSRGVAGVDQALGGDRFASFRGAVMHLDGRQPPASRDGGGAWTLTVPRGHQFERRSSDLRAAERLPVNPEDCGSAGSISDDECSSPTKPGRKSSLGGGLGSGPGRRIGEAGNSPFRIIDN